MGELLATAERLARELRHGFVSREHFWLALADPAVGSRVAVALASLGVDAGEVRRAFLFTIPVGEKERRSVRMNPAVQEQLERAEARARHHSRDTVTDVDITIAWLDANEAEYGRDLVLHYLARRGLDTTELRRRFEEIEAKRSAAEAFEILALPKAPPRRRQRRRPSWLPPLKPNPLGHDPWTRGYPWGSAFAVRKDERLCKVDGAQWFFSVDSDGYFVRTADGRPLGYRYSIVKKGGRIAEASDAGDPSLRAIRKPPREGSIEVLPMPPSDIARWPDHRYVREDG